MYEQITNKILALLRRGVIPWRKSWSDEISLPLNAKTHRPYKGINIMLLWMAEQRSPYWATAKVWKELGNTVVEGQISTPVCFFTTFVGKNGKRIPFLRQYELYNQTQVVGKTIKKQEESNMPDEFIEASGAVIVNGPPCFDIKHDCIYCPLRGQFVSDAAYYTTILHELAHWTGHHSRLNRVFGFHKRSREYAFEELVAELASCFLAALLKIPQALDEMPNHASYVSDWLNVLGEDSRAIFRAAAAAQRVVMFLEKNKIAA